MRKENTARMFEPGFKEKQKKKPKNQNKKRSNPTKARYEWTRERGAKKKTKNIRTMERCCAHPNIHDPTNTYGMLAWKWHDSNCPLKSSFTWRTHLSNMCKFLLSQNNCEID